MNDTTQSTPAPSTTPPARPTVLVIEISNPSAAPHAAFVAMGNDEGRCAGHEPLCTEHGGRDDLHPAIERLSSRLGVAPNELLRVAISVGPGGYTGLRVAVAAGLLIAEATGARLVSIPTARLVARSVRPTGFPRGIALASKGDACHLTIENLKDDFSTVGMVRAEDFSQFGLQELIADRHLPGTILNEAQSLGISILEPVFSPEAACRLAVEIDPTDPSDLAVCYAREPDAVTQWRARHEHR